MQTSRRLELSIPEALAGQRLDQALARLLPEYSRSRIKTWIEAGSVVLNGASPRPREPVAAGDRVVVSIAPEPGGELTPEAIPLDVLYADDALIVINKPAGLVVHPGAGNRAGTLQHALLNLRPALAEVPRAGIVHRLDKDTSGLLVVAASLPAHTALVRAMAAREVERQYEAVCVGRMVAGGRIDKPIGRHPVDRTRMTVRAGGRPAVTHYRIIERFRKHTHLGVRLETGRTHQIRVHLAALHHPLVGDPVYGGRARLPGDISPALAAVLAGFRRQALHASRLRLAHPVSGEMVQWEAPLPDDLRELLAALRADAQAQA
jgi:23S rRNA pseudouridine1911/1915/1917 synthase